MLNRDKIVLEFIITKNGGIVEPKDLKNIINTLDRIVPILEDKTVIISGRLPVWLFSAVVAKLSKVCRDVAVFDPRLGGGVVVYSRSGDVGKVIECEPSGDFVVKIQDSGITIEANEKMFTASRENSLIVFLAGPPKAGKSTVSFNVYRQLLRHGLNVFLERANPDMEGNWTIESGIHELAKRYKEILKKEGVFYSQEFVKQKIQHINNLAKTFDIVLVDLGGMPSREVEELIKGVKGNKIAILLPTEDLKYVDLNNKWLSLLFTLSRIGAISDFDVISGSLQRKINRALSYIMSKIKEKETLNKILINT